MNNLLISAFFLFNTISLPLNDIYPSGENIVFEIRPEGLIITGTYNLDIGETSYNPSKDSDIQVGDIIIEVNDIEIDSINGFISTISTKKQNRTFNLELLRDEAKISRNLNVYYINNQMKTGLLVKERVLGVGTLTFIDTDKHIYGALGHEVIDNSTKEIIEVDKGYIYQEDVIKISKGNNGNPGEKLSSTNLDVKLGEVIANTEYGLFGRTNSSSTNFGPMELAKKSEVKVGKAQILTCLKENKVEAFDIEITKLSNSKLKGITFKITDKRLLDQTGGVYSGMSGSPIIQNNKIVGAVTHVIVNDIKSGYGIYIDNMYQECIKNTK